MKQLRFAVGVIYVCAISGCGTAIPTISEPWDRNYPGNPNPGHKTPSVSATAQIEFEIKKRIYCELKKAVHAANRYPITQSETLGGKQTVEYKSLIPPGWVAQIALSLEVDESTSLNPGVSWTDIRANAIRTFGVQNTVTTAQYFNFGLGATASSTATRIDKFNPEYTVAFLSQPFKADSICIDDGKHDPFERMNWTPAASSPFLIQSNLGIKDWLLGALVFNALIPSDVVPAKDKSTSKDGGGNKAGKATIKADTISYEVKFIIVSNGNVTPTWKLVRFTGNQGSSPLFSTGRIRTHDLIITIGPDTTVTSNAHLAAQISSGVASAIKGAGQNAGN